MRLPPVMPHPHSWLQALERLRVAIACASLGDDSASDNAHYVTHGATAACKLLTMVVVNGTPNNTSSLGLSRWGARTQGTMMKLLSLLLASCGHPQLAKPCCVTLLPPGKRGKRTGRRVLFTQVLSRSYREGTS
jgi:hypothetical protein